jgi:peptidoglycan/LPS O-acetylase OafA/YrhL
MLTTDRRYDIDWVRVIAIWLLLIYHAAIGFQPWGMMIGFITNAKSWTSLWTPMALLNVWRIPLLFFVSGMGVYFAIQNRNWKQLFLERASRILVPFVFGSLCIVPLHIFIMSKYYNTTYTYFPHSGHLWFLGNIIVYILLFAPVFYYLKQNANGKLALTLKKIIQHPIGLLLIAVCFVIEVVIINPQPYEYYVMNLHGFFLGMLAFFFGFCFVYSAAPFWKMIEKLRWLFLLAGLLLFTLRVAVYNMMTTPIYQLPIETVCWILAVLAFAKRYLNHNSKILQYLSKAAYPVYVLHMIFLYWGSSLIFPLPLNAPLQFILTLIFTLAGCYLTYEMIRRIKVFRFLFGIQNATQPAPSQNKIQT